MYQELLNGDVCPNAITTSNSYETISYTSINIIGLNYLQWFSLHIYLLSCLRPLEQFGDADFSYKA